MPHCVAKKKKKKEGGVYPTRNVRSFTYQLGLHPLSKLLGADSEKTQQCGRVVVVISLLRNPPVSDSKMWSC